MEYTEVGAIVIITYLIGLACKQIPIIKNNVIPVIVGFCGAILGVVAMYVMPDFPATNVLDAIAVGIVSGLASTGLHQIYKQIKEGLGD